MSYKNIEDKRKFQREWIQKRRQDFFSDKVCGLCGSTDNLQLHHRDPKAKTSHKIWSWSEERREAEIEKCDVLCQSCHAELETEKLRRFEHGIANTYKKGCRCRECLNAQYKTMRRVVSLG